MAMPETSMHKDSGPIFWENDIRPARKTRSVKSKTETFAMEKASEENFRLGILAPDTGHVPAA